MINPQKINPLDYFPSPVVFGGMGVAMAVAVAHYGTGQVFNSIFLYAKKRIIGLSSALILAKVMGLAGLTVSETFSNTAQALAFASIAYMAALPLIHYGPGQVTNSIMSLVKKGIFPALTGLTFIGLTILGEGIFFNNPAQALTFASVGVALIHYSPGQVANSVVNLVKKGALFALIGLTVTSLAIALSEIGVKGMLNFAQQFPGNLAGFGAAYAIGAILIDCGAGHVTNSIRALTIHPIITGLTACIAGSILGLLHGVSIVCSVYEPTNNFFTMKNENLIFGAGKYPSISEVSYHVLGRTVAYGIFLPLLSMGPVMTSGVIPYFLGKYIMKASSGEGGAFLPFIKSSYGAGVIGLIVGEALGLLYSVPSMIRTYKNGAFIMDLNYDSARGIYVSIWD
jgi:hypothetical protein